MVDVAQLVRASGCGPGGRGFESHHPPFLIFDCFYPVVVLYFPPLEEGNFFAPIV